MVTSMQKMRVTVARVNARKSKHRVGKCRVITEGIILERTYTIFLKLEKHVFSFMTIFLSHKLALFGALLSGFLGLFFGNDSFHDLLGVHI